LNRPIVAMSRTVSGKGYWLVGADGGVFTFGDARFHGSGGSKFFGVVIDLAPGANGRGYWLPNSVGPAFQLGEGAVYRGGFRRNIELATGIAATAPLIGPQRVARIIEAPLPQLGARLAQEALRRVLAG